MGLQSITSATLLERLLDRANHTVWSEFDERYRPIVIGFARRLGLGEEDAQEAAQETLAQFARDYREGKYDPARGRLRAWMIGIARNRVRDIRRQAAVAGRLRGESALAHLPDDASTDTLWNEECDHAVMREALTMLAEREGPGSKTLRAFQMQVQECRAPAEVAGALGMSVRAVYLAKHRCLKRLRKLAEELAAAYELP